MLLSVTASEASRFERSEETRAQRVHHNVMFMIWLSEAKPITFDITTYTVLQASIGAVRK